MKIFDEKVSFLVAITSKPNNSIKPPIDKLYDANNTQDKHEWRCRYCVWYCIIKCEDTKE